MKTLGRLATSCLVGILSIGLTGCSGSGSENANESGAGGALTAGATTAGGATTKGAGGATTKGTGGATTKGTGGATTKGAGGATTKGAGGATTKGTEDGTSIGAGGTNSMTTIGTTTIGNAGTTSTDTSQVKVLLAGTNVNADGPLKTTVLENVSFSGGGHILARPTDITKEPNTKHPVAIWGPGGGTPPSEYLMLLKRMASHGFVVVAIRESSGGSELMSAAIDWLEKQNADPSSPMYDRLILNRVGVFGHSMGGLSSEATAKADPRVTTALLDNSGSTSQNGLVSVKIPVGIIYGEEGIEKVNAAGDYGNMKNKGPCWLGRMAGGGHGSGPWDGAGANVAWMRWHIGGENFRKDAFLGNGGEYNNKGIWATQFKNWDGWKNWNE